MKTFRNLVHYCTTAEYPDIPFRVRSCGHYNVAGDYHELPWQGDFLQLYWCMEGEGYQIIRNRRHPLHPGEVCFFLAGDVREMGGCGNFCRYRWLAVEGPTAMPLWQGLRLSQLPRQVGRCPEELFIQLEEEIIDYTPDGLRLASATAFRILMLAAGRTPTVVPSYDYAGQARAVIDSQYRNPQLNIGGVADRLGVNRSQLSRKFHAIYGVSPAQYLINRRIQYGLELLANSELQIKEIAARSGFADPNYFTKAIKKYAGEVIRGGKR